MCRSENPSVTCFFATIKYAKGSFVSKVGSPQGFTNSVALGARDFMRARNATTTACKAGFEVWSFALAFTPGMRK